MLLQYEKTTISYCTFPVSSESDSQIVDRYRSTLSYIQYPCNCLAKSNCSILRLSSYVLVHKLGHPLSFYWTHCQISWLYSTFYFHLHIMFSTFFYLGWTAAESWRNHWSRDPTRGQRIGQPYPGLWRHIFITICW